MYMYNVGIQLNIDILLLCPFPPLSLFLFLYPLSLLDKRQHHPRSGPGAPVQHPGVGGPSCQGSTKAARYHGDRRWSGQRNKSPRQDNGRDRLKETENVCSCVFVCLHVCVCMCESVSVKLTPLQIE